MKLSHALLGASLATGLVAFAMTNGDADASERMGRQERARIELGRRLFMDATVSGAGKFSCADCHDPEHGFSDPRRFSVDENGLTARHSQPVVELMGDGFHWDGEFETPEQLLVARLGTPAEAMAQMGELLRSRFEASEAAGLNPDKVEFERRIQSLTPPYYGPVTRRGRRGTVTPLAVRLGEDGRYDTGFRAAFGHERVETESLVGAMAAYMQSLEYAESPFDRFLAGDEDAISASAQRGFHLFQNEANCASCHTVDGSRPTFSDGKFHNTGVAFRRAPVPHLGDLATQASLGVTPVESDPIAKDVPRTTASDGGRSTMTFAPSHTGLFKTPSLRDVAIRPPYMHDGSFATLHDVVDYYVEGGTENEHLDPHVGKLDLDAGDRADLVAFLESLTGVERPGLGRLADRPNDRMRLIVQDLDGNPMKELELTVTATGDRLSGETDVPREQLLATNRSGFVNVDLPAATHVVVESAFHEIEMTRAIPDYVKTQTVIATPLDRIAMRVVISGEREPPETLTVSALDLGASETAAPIEFRMHRPLDRDEWLYVAEKGPLDGERLARISAGARGDFDTVVDFSGGMTETVHLSLRPLPPVRPGRRTAGNERARGGVGPIDRQRDNLEDKVRGGLKDPPGRRNR